MRVDDARVDLEPISVTLRIVVSHTYVTYTDYTLEFSVMLSNLTNGSHSIIYGNAPPSASSWINPYISELTPNIYFNVSASSPKISILLPENETYVGASVSLNFRISEVVSWVGYSIDEQPPVTITGNTTLAGLAEGMHSLTVYANDTVGRKGVSDTVCFSISQKTEDEPQPEQPLFPIALTVVPVASEAVIAAGLLVYFKKRKR